ncbi:hypothetical protein NL676_032531 [Syzygium grande]|nr:hypothetical protein NL676_032531 [Syzygium grande]
MKSQFLIALVLVLLRSLMSCHGGVLLSTLPRTILVSASPQPGQVLKAGEDTVTVKWSFNQSVLTSQDNETYKTIKATLCYAPVSQDDRAWRKTFDDLSKDKTCQFTIVEEPYAATDANNASARSFEWTIQKYVPTATYFVRAYAYDSDGIEKAYGQTTDEKKTADLFRIESISGRHASLEIAAGCFSAFALASLFGLFWAEKAKKK